MVETEIPSLERIVYSKTADAVGNGERWTVIGLSRKLTPDDATLWRSLVTLMPLDAPTEPESLAVGLFHGPEQDYLLAHAFYQPGDPARCLCQHIWVPRPLLEQATANLQFLVEAAIQALPEDLSGAPLAPFPWPALSEQPTEDRAAFLARLLAEQRALNIPTLLALLDAALSERRLLIRGFSPDWQVRLMLVQALLLLLPPPARPEITFATHVKAAEPARAQIVFGEQKNSTTRWIADLANGPVDIPLQTPYAQCLAQIWRDDLPALVAELEKIAAATAVAWDAGNVRASLTRLAERHQLDVAVLADGEIPAEQLRAVWQDDPPRSGALRARYALRLLDYALQARDPDSALLVARAMDADADLRAALIEILAARLVAEPDAVYFFVRTHLAQGLNPDWLPLLQEAATASMQIALDSGDNDILLEWLKLIAREPASYQLAEVLQNGILETQQRAREDGDLGRRLLLLAGKRAPALVERLLDDAAVLARLDAPVGTALRDYEATSVGETIQFGREIALILLGNAVRDAATNPAAAAVFTPLHLDYLWTWLYAGDIPPELPGRFTPAAILNKLATEGDEWLNAEALQSLLNRIVKEENVGLLRRLGVRLAERNALFPLLVVACQTSGLSAEKILTLIGEISPDELLTPQQTVNLYLRLIDQANWQREAGQPLVEQIARLLQQDPDITVPVEVLWQMLQIALEGTMDMVVRVVSRRIFAYIETTAEDARLVDLFLRLHEQLRKDAPSRAFLLSRWREFALRQPLARLERLDELLAERRAREEVRAIIQTDVAVKKVIGLQALVDFAAAIHLTYTTLQTLSTAFDPLDHPAAFDQATVRAELETRAEELPVEQRRLLAKNLKELAQLIAVMAEHRSKSSLMRREEDIERQLTTGEQAPHGAVDTLKWLSGYLNGAQTRPGEEEKGNSD